MTVSLVSMGLSHPQLDLPACAHAVPRQRRTRDDIHPVSDSLLHVFRTLDLFAGAGGLTEGFRIADSRFVTSAAVESDVAAAATYAMNQGKMVYRGSVAE